MPSQLVKLALIDPAAYIASGVESDLDVEKFSIFQEGAQNASRQVFSIEPNIVQIQGGNEFIESKTYAIDVAGLFDSSKRAKIKGWSKNRTPLYVSGYGLDGHILYGQGAITEVVGSENNVSFRFRIQNDAKGGYDSSTTKHSSGLIYSENGACHYKWQANPSNANLIPLWYNGFNILGVDPAGSLDTGEELTEGDPAYSFSSGGLRVQCDADDKIRLYQSLFFPFDNVNLNFTTNIPSYTSGSGNDAFVRILYMTDDFDEINSGTNTRTNITGTGDVTASITTGVGTNVVKINHSVLEDIDVIFKNPRLTIDTVKPFTEFNT